jgi:2-dehydropantoate 2-reductase
MKIAVLGAGAMGSIFGGWLSRRHEVWLIDIWQEHCEAINTNGLLIEENGQIHRFHPRAVPNAHSVGPVELVIIFVKSIDTATALAQNRELFTPQTLALTLQNGWGNAEEIRPYVGAANLFVGTTAHGGNVRGPGRVCHAGRGPTSIGVLSGPPGRARKIAALFSDAGLTAEVTDNAGATIWRKLIINAAINPLTALLEVPNGYLTESATTRELMALIIKEAVRVANGTGIPFEVTELIDTVQKVARQTAPNRSSMLQDLTNQRPTEIDRINGAIVAQGNALGIATPYNQMLFQLIKAKEEIK